MAAIGAYSTIQINGEKFEASSIEFDPCHNYEHLGMRARLMSVDHRIHATLKGCQIFSMGSTHSVKMVTRTVKRWQFPKERFVTYESSDESWCRYAGIGEEVNDEQYIEIPNAYVKEASVVTRGTFAETKITFCGKTEGNENTRQKHVCMHE